MEKQKNRFGNCACACCGNFTIPQIHETCPVCFWEEDFYQESHMRDSGGPNLVCINEARENFIRWGASEVEFINLVRKPTAEEQIRE